MSGNGQGMPQTVYFKRFQMDILLREPVCVPSLPDGYRFVAWSESLLEAHAEVKFSSFRDTIDAVVFPSLGTLLGCQLLMQAISRRPTFVPEGTWLLLGPHGYCGTVQGIHDGCGTGAIQNLGVLPGERGKGLGAALLLQALAGFRSRGLHRGFLEVTVDNVGAVRLYRRLGFRCRKTVYKPVEVNGPSRDHVNQSARDFGLTETH